jgi:hypothetical protein
MITLRCSWLILLTSTAACSPLSQQQRLARGTLDCAHRVLDRYVPQTAADQIQHCRAAGFIARYCSVSEGYLLGAAKELADAVGPGDFEWRDWQSDRIGIACARSSNSDEALGACCNENTVGKP